MSKSTLKDTFLFAAKVAVSAAGTTIALGGAWLMKDFAFDPTIPAKALAIPGTIMATGAFYGIGGVVALINGEPSRANKSAQPS